MPCDGRKRLRTAEADRGFNVNPSVSRDIQQTGWRIQNRELIAISLRRSYLSGEQALDQDVIPIGHRGDRSEFAVENQSRAVCVYADESVGTLGLLDDMNVGFTGDLREASAFGVSRRVYQARR